LNQNRKPVAVLLSIYIQKIAGGPFNAYKHNRCPVAESHILP